ncbi:hypothetical protein [Streptomyces sp. NPDC051776]|uniref:hypothetical protein n=1 Tax=Streptomyces sp. NPDC051776 TaxID=3155414 RepID=UPI00342E5D33
MRAHKIATATMLVLAVSGWGVAGSGAAYADNGPAHGGKAKAAEDDPAHGGRAKARAQGGSATGEGASLFQQNVAQSARQNNNCNNPNTEDEEISLTGSRATGRCVTTDGSLTAFSPIHNGPADAEGGSATASLIQQDTAQRGRQNNTCNNPNESPITVEGGRVESHCSDQDFSFSKHTLIKGSGARAEGGSSTAGTVRQQNIAQEGRQNNACTNLSNTEPDVTGGGRVQDRCKNRDHSLSKHTLIKSGGARAEGGSSTAADVDQQNIAQEGRQNNACNNRNQTFPFEVTGTRTQDRCQNRDHSLSKHTLIKSGGAHAEGGSSSDSGINQQNIAQEGRQNNTCNDPSSFGSFEVTEGGRTQDRCQNRDHSLSKHTLIKSGGAHAEGGSTSVSDIDQHNIAQEGRQNNACNNPNATGDVEVTGGRTQNRCQNRDHSLSKATLVKGGGARAEGGSSTGGGVNQQNIAQEGRQNNACNNPSQSGNFEVSGGGRTQDRCQNRDHSLSKHTLVKGGGARAEGGSSTGGTVSQQNVAQEGRQNNACNNLNRSGDIEVSGGGRTQDRCQNRDHSLSKHTLVKGGGARAEGGSSTGGTVSQQNVAQEGRQNNTCNNLNDTVITVEGGRSEASCKTADHSANLYTADIGGGAKAAGGSATADLFQQNVAQEGRQNNTCANPNNLNLTATGSRTKAECVAVDHSTNIATING